MRLYAENLSVERAGHLVLGDVGFRIESGQALVATGENGAGKSTLLAAIAGMLPVAGGRLELEGAGEWSRAELCHHVIFRDALKPSLTLREMLAFFAALLAVPQPGLPMALDAEAALAEFDLLHAVDMPVSYLSTGQRQRLSLTRLVVAPRPLWLLDEPVNAMDAASRRRFIALMERHLSSGGMIVAATHVPLGLEGALRLELPAREGA